MKRKIHQFRLILRLVILNSLCFVAVVVSGQGPSTLKLFYDKPASKWVEALPVGNGRIGAMIFGGVEEELLQLNESTLWSGGPVKASVHPEAYQYLT